MASVMPSYIPELSTGGFTIKTSTELGHQEMYFECDQSLSGFWWTDEVEFRRAAAWAIDKNRIVDEVWQGYASPIDPFLSSAYGVWSWEDQAPSHMYPGNPSKGRQIILDNYANVTYNNETGWLESGGEPLEAELMCTNTPVELQEVSIVVSGLESLGIQITINSMGWTTLINNLLSDNYQLMMMGWGLLPEPFFIQDLAFSMSAGDVNWQNDTYDMYASKMGNAETLEEAVTYAHKAMEIYYYEQPFISLYASQIVSAYMKEDWEGVVIGLGMSAANTWTFRKLMHEVEVEEPADGDGGDGGQPFPWLWIAGFSALSAIVTGAIVFYVLRRRKPPE